jgi:MFS family permease
MSGTLSVQIRGEMDFSELALGGLVTTYSGLVVFMAVPAGRLVDRIGYRWGLVLAPLLAGVALLGSGLFAHEWWHLALGQVFGAGGAAVAIPAVQLALTRRIAPERQGIALGLNLASVPLAILLAGIAVPLVGETVGWRWAFGGAGAIGLAVSVASVLSFADAGWGRIREVRQPIQRRLVLLGSGAMFLGVWSAQTVATFAVEAGVDAGHTAGSIGYVLAIASFLSVGARIISGSRADRTGPVGAFGVILLFVLAGALGTALLAVGGSFLVIAVGVVLGLGFGWGWNGVLAYAMIRPNPRAAATTASFMMIGGFGGSALSPIASGALVSGPGFAAAWVVSTVAMLGAAVLTSLAGRDPRLSKVV